MLERRIGMVRSLLVALLDWCAWAGEAIAEPVLGGDVRLAGDDGLELVPEIADRHPQEMHVSAVPATPHRAQHLPMRDQLAGVLEQVHQTAGTQ